MKLHRYVDHQRLHIVTKDVISLSISVLLLFRHYISHKITFGAPSSGGVLRSACGAFIFSYNALYTTCCIIIKNVNFCHQCCHLNIHSCSKYYQYICPIVRKQQNIKFLSDILCPKDTANYV